LLKERLAGLADRKTAVGGGSGDAAPALILNSERGLGTGGVTGGGGEAGRKGALAEPGLAIPSGGLLSRKDTASGNTNSSPPSDKINTINKSGQKNMKMIETNME
jgi:hypothetical protein